MGCPESDIRLSVVLATRNRSSSLGALLDSLERQVNPPVWELVVCDNGSNDDTASVLQRYAARMPLIHLYEALPGKSRALNRALAVVRGELVVFTDDDVVVDSHWLNRFCRAGSDYPDHNVFGGRVMVDESVLPGWLVHSPRLQGLLVSAHSRGDEVITYSFNDYPFGPNMAVRRSTLAQREVHWPTELGPGTALPVGDERLFLYYVSRPESRDRLYHPDIIVHHSIEPDQITATGAIKRYYLLGKSDKHFIRCTRDDSQILIMWPRHLFRHLATSRFPIEILCVLARVLGRYF